MQRWITRGALAVLAAAALSSCSETPNSPTADVAPTPQHFVGSGPDVVISQIYGGGGNSGGIFKNDFIEIFNAGSTPVSLDGWSVQYASTSGTTWQVTALTNVTLQPGQYYLVQEAAGSGAQPALPTPDATGSIAMSASNGKVVLSSGSSALSGACPVGGTVVDAVSFAAATCATEWDSPGTAALANATAAIRKDAGCTNTGKFNDDFVVATPTPRNTASPLHVCDVVVDPVVVDVTVEPATATISIAGTQTFSASATNAGGDPVPTTFTWESRDEAVASVDASGKATGLAEGSTYIVATSLNGVKDSALLTVEFAEPPTFGDVVISQVYGGGGNSGATLTHDYVELFNRGDEPADIGGWRVYYGSSTSTSWSNFTTLPEATIPAGGYYLVRLASNANVGTPLDVFDASGTLNLSGTAGKVLLTAPDVAPAAVACPDDSGIVDRFNFGNANCAGTWGSISGLNNTTAAWRLNDGCVDTDNVTADFVTGSTSPRSSASPLKDCSAPPPSTAKLIINELMADPLNASGGASWGEWFEVYNYGDTPIDMQGWTISSNGQPDHVIVSSVVVPAGGYAVLGRGADFNQNGGVALDYNYFVGNTNTQWLDNTDVLSLKDASNNLVDAVSWSSASVIARGVTRAVRVATDDNADVGGANWGYSTVTFGDGDFGTPGAPNGTLSNSPPDVRTISFIRRDANEGPLPVGFEDQLFADLLDGNGVEDTTAVITWSSETPDIATVDQDGVVHALTVGTAIIRATANDGTTRTVSMETELALPSGVVYGNNTEFGDPLEISDDGSDDVIVRHPEFTTSFNGTTNIPNWVAYEIDASHIGPTDRCNCFTYDADLPERFTRYTTAAYTGAGAYHHYGIDRGHLARSFDRTSGRLDNARTFLLSNIIPQAAKLNQGAWAQMENYLGALATGSNKEVYVVAGATGSKGTLKDEGLITIPETLWKVAVIMPRDKGLADVDSYDDVEVIAIIVANDSTRGSDNWETWKTTVDAVEALSGFDLLSLLPDQIEIAVESSTHPPVAVANGPYTSSEGSSVFLSATASSDADAGQTLTYAWDFGDGSTASGSELTHTYVQDGTYTVTLTVTDPLGLMSTVMTTATVGNVAPDVSAIAGATLLPGETYSASGSFSDPGADSWSATVDYGEGGTNALVLSGQSFTLSHTYNTAGTFTVTVQVSDDDAAGYATATVTVLTPAQALENLSALVTDTGLNDGNENSLLAKLAAADSSLANGNAGAAINQLNAFINQVNALEAAGKLSAERAAELRAEAQRIIDSLG